MLTVVLDTHVLVSGLLSQKSWPAKILDLVLSDHIQVAYDDRVAMLITSHLARKQKQLDDFHQVVYTGGPDGE